MIRGNPITVGGGGGGLSKCSIIVHIDTGSTVGAYSNSAATTLVKAGKEIGTSGDYVITGLEVGTYYVKATKNEQTAVSKAVSFTGYGVKEISLNYLVPPEYQAVEYLKSSGTQYINTNKSLATYGTNIIIEVDARYTGFGSGLLRDFICGAIGSKYNYIGVYDDNLTLQYGNDGANFGAPNTLRHLYKIDANSRKAYIDETMQTLPTPSAAVSFPFHVFAANNNGNADFLSKIELYHLLIKDSADTKIMELIPCYRKSDSVAGLWDKVSETFYTNAGSGTFVVGGNI